MKSLRKYIKLVALYEYPSAMILEISTEGVYPLIFIPRRFSPKKVCTTTSEVIFCNSSMIEMGVLPSEGKFSKNSLVTSLITGTLFFKASKWNELERKFLYLVHFLSSATTNPSPKASRAPNGPSTL